MPHCMRATPSWNVCVFTTTETPEEYRSVKNSLLWADHTHWISPELYLKLAKERIALWAKSAEERNAMERTVGGFSIDPLRVLGGYYSVFNRELANSGATDVITHHLGVRETLDLEESVMTSIKSGLSGELVAAKAREVIDKLLEKPLAESQVFVSEWPFLEKDDSKRWKSRNVAHELMMTVSRRLIFSDVSTLPIEAIMNIRDQLKDSLDPVRAEMLSLTEDLRKIVSGNQSKEFISAEADNLIATRVEPVVRDANRRAKELMDRKWSKFLTGVAKAFGFAGAGFLDSKLFAKAIQQTLETGALGLKKGEEDRTNFKATSQFVLHARRLVP